MTTTANAPDKMSGEQRTAALERYVSEAGRQGWRVQSMSASQAQLVKGKHHSHILHLVLTLITLGLWLLVWIPLAVFGGEKQRLVTVDEFGRVHES